MPAGKEENPRSTELVGASSPGHALKKLPVMPPPFGGRDGEGFQKFNISKKGVEGIFQSACSTLSPQCLGDRVHVYHPSSCSPNLAYEQVYEEMQRI